MIQWYSTLVCLDNTILRQWLDCSGQMQHALYIWLPSIIIIIAKSAGISREENTDSSRLFRYWLGWSSLSSSNFFIGHLNWKSGQVANDLFKNSFSTHLEWGSIVSNVVTDTAIYTCFVLCSVPDLLEWNDWLVWSRKVEFLSESGLRV